ncbi:MAG: hypothetical protein ACK5JT_04470 [Hyphomicrobiaceae bacterium]
MTGLPGLGISLVGGRRRHFAIVAAVAASLGGCGLPGGTVSSAPDITLGSDGQQQYAFARARVPVVVEGRIIDGRRGRTLRASLSVGQPKYVVDSGVSIKIPPRPADRYRATIDSRFLLRNVVSLAGPDGREVLPAPAAGLTDVPAMLEKHLPASATSITITRPAHGHLEAFRLEKELDPGAPEEIRNMQAELDRVALGWNLQFAFAAVPVEATVGTQTVVLMPSRSADCSYDICFRLPVAYELTLALPSSGWKGKAKTHVWLANDGPIAAIDTSGGRFAAVSGQATFRDGMLMSLTGKSVEAALRLLKFPQETKTSSSRSSSVR